MALMPVKSDVTFLPYVASVTNKIQFLALPVVPFHNVVEKPCLQNTSINRGGRLSPEDEGGGGLSALEG